GAGGATPLRPEALADLFRIVGGVACVVLNACHSATQAQAIVKYVDAVIGMSRNIQNDAAINFSWAFYQALGFGQPIEQAFELGQCQIDLASLEGKDVPTLLRSRALASASADDRKRLVLEVRARGMPGLVDLLDLLLGRVLAGSYRIDTLSKIGSQFA